MGYILGCFSRSIEDFRRNKILEDLLNHHKNERFIGFVKRIVEISDKPTFDWLVKSARNFKETELADLLIKTRKEIKEE